MVVVDGDLFDWNEFCFYMFLSAGDFVITVVVVSLLFMMKKNRIEYRLPWFSLHNSIPQYSCTFIKFLACLYWQPETWKRIIKSKTLYGIFRIWTVFSPSKLIRHTCCRTHVWPLDWSENKPNNLSIIVLVLVSNVDLIRDAHTREREKEVIFTRKITHSLRSMNKVQVSIFTFILESVRWEFDSVLWISWWFSARYDLKNSTHTHTSKWLGFRLCAQSVLIARWLVINAKG